MTVNMAVTCVIVFLTFFINLSSSAEILAANSLKFNIIGDWGGLPDFPYRTLVETAIAAQLGKVTANLGSEFTLGLGDNFYYDGVKDVNDKRFDETFEMVFTNPSLQNPWYFVAGNHDHNGNVSAEIAYTNVSHRWNFPNYYYYLPFPSSTMAVDIVMIDTVLLCGQALSDFSHEPLRGPKNPTMAADQWAWIEKTLQMSKAQYLIVAGHYPVWSIAEHGPTKCLLDRLMPMLYQYNVTAYMCGHDHNLQHLQYSMSGKTVDYFVVGSANFIDTSTAHESDVPDGSLKFHWADKLSLGGFGFMEVTPNNMTFSFLESSGRVLYHRVMLPRKL